MTVATSFLICGPDGSGKSTLAKALANILQIPITPMATAIRERVIEEGFHSREEVYAKPTPPEIRQALRAVGQSGREESCLYWAKEFLKAQMDSPSVLVDDSRFLLDSILVSHNWRAPIVYLDGPIPSELASEPTFMELPLLRAAAHLVISPFSESPGEMAQYILQKAQWKPILAGKLPNLITDIRW